MRIIWKVTSLLLFLSGVYLVGISHVQAQDPLPTTVTDDQVNAIAQKLYCPVCENIPLDVCPTQACEEWRELIREKIAEGWSEKQIIDYFIAQYGDRVIGVPPARGLNWLIYVITALIVLAGVITLVVLISVWSKQTKVKLQTPTYASENPEDVNLEYISQIEAQLKKR